MVVREDPLNCEVRLGRLAEGAVTPNERFYIRSHFPVPAIKPGEWRLQVRGLVRSPLSLSLDDLRKMPAREDVVTLECAGNGRSLFRPKIEGEPWGLGAVSTAVWKGVSLASVLDAAGLQKSTSHLVFRAAEGFERGLSRNEGRQTLLAFEMNGRPLPPDHGHPVRAIVPGWYAVASVKWLTEIEATDRPLEGHFQTDRYVYELPDSREPVTHQKVRSLITQPEDAATVRAGRFVIRGLAWSGSAPVTRVDVSLGSGRWTEAALSGSHRHAWKQWEMTAQVERPGRLTIRSRATDASRQTQPEHAPWNRLGYGNNSIQTVAVRVV